MTESLQNSQDQRRRRWWLAALPQLLGGVGSIYVGRPIRFVVLLMINAIGVLGLYHGYSGMMASTHVVIPLLVGVLLLMVFCFVDANRLAVRQRDYALRWYNRPWIYLTCSVAALAFGQIPELLEGKVERAVRLYTIPAGSMAPTLQIGDYVLTGMKAFDVREPRRGELAVFRLPSNPDTAPKDGLVTRFVRFLATDPGEAQTELPVQQTR